jgi:predicted nicotinamide N-methyase
VARAAERVSETERRTLDPHALIAEFTRVARVPLVPELRLHLAEQLVPLWQATEWQAAAPQPPPFWAFAWPGSQALARHIVDAPDLLRGKRVLDFGAGSGLAAIAAAAAGARGALAVDIDPVATVVQRLNAELNGVAIDAQCADVVDAQIDADVVLAGDVCYEREGAERSVRWFRALVRSGVTVLLADPGRHYVPSEGLQLVATYDVPTLHDLESVAEKRTRIWRMLER